MGIIFTTYIHLDDPPKMMPMTYDESNFEDELTHSMGENVGFVHAKWKPLQKDRLFLERLDMLSSNHDDEKQTTVWVVFLLILMVNYCRQTHLLHLGPAMNFCVYHCLFPSDCW